MPLIGMASCRLLAGTSRCKSNRGRGYGTIRESLVGGVVFLLLAPGSKLLQRHFRLALHFLQQNALFVERLAAWPYAQNPAEGA